MTYRNTSRMARLILAAALPVVVLTPLGMAQVPGPATTQESGDADTSLAAILADNTALLSSLDARGQEKLLAYAFDKYKISPDQQSVYRLAHSLDALLEGKAGAQTQKMVANVIGNIGQILATRKDPQYLMKVAAALVESGTRRDVNTLEYWGENPKTQARLRPVAEAVAKLYERVMQMAQAESDTLEKSITSPESPAAKKWEEAQKQLLLAQFSKAFNDYSLALSLDAADPKRATIANSAITVLADQDNPESGVQNIVRLGVGKLLLIKGGKGDFEKARERFKQVADDTAAGWSQRYEAVYFSALSNLLAKDLSGAQKAQEALRLWLKTNPPVEKDPVALKAYENSIDAADRMLQYRLHSLEFDQTKDQKAYQASVTDLLELVKARPDLRTITFEQLISKLPDEPDVTKLDPLFLQAIIGRGEQETHKKEGYDKKILDTAIAAAQEMQHRKDQPGVTPDDLEKSAFLLGFFYDDADLDAQGANAYLDYIEKFKPTAANAEWHRLAFDNATYLVGLLTKDKKDDPAVTKLYRRFLGVATAPPLNRTEFAYAYGRLLLHDNQEEISALDPKDTTKKLELLKTARNIVAILQKAPRNDEKLVVFTEFTELLALKQQIDLDASDKAAVNSAIAQTTNQMHAHIVALLPKVDAETQRNLRATNVRATLLSADLVRRDEATPAPARAQRTLDLLKTFDTDVDGLPGADALLGEAMYLRVQAFMASGQDNKATDELVKLLQNNQGAKGAEIVFNLLTKLDDELNKARASGNNDRIRELARSRAKLSGFLVSWARDNQNPEIKKYTYRYMVFDAATKQLAGQVETDPTQRTALLQDSLKLYKSLLEPANATLYKGTLDPAKKTDANAPDPVVLLGVALVEYDLGNFAEAQPILTRLLADRKLGAAKTVRKDDDGTERVVDNEQYWEAMTRMLACNLKIIANPPANFDKDQLKRETEGKLKELFIRWGTPGGAKWSSELTTMRKELLPDWVVPQLDTTTQTTAPSTQP